MENTDAEVLGAARAWLEQGHRVTLATVARTWGSSPRPPGSLMVMGDDGRSAGSVSGGCVEQDLLERVRAGGQAATLPAVIVYGAEGDQAQRRALPCGGRLELVVETLTATEAVTRLLESMEHRRAVVRRLSLATGEVQLEAAHREREFFYDGTSLEKVFGPTWRLLLIGAGHLSRCVAQIALGLDYEVVVCDPREEYAKGWGLAGTTLDSRMPDDVVTALADDERTAVVALTHDPRLDDLALMEALASRAFYVGALGSRITNAKRRERLASLGLGPESLDRLHGPVGLPIGSRTAPEIAVSVLAELTAVRRGAPFDGAARGAREEAIHPGTAE